MENIDPIQYGRLIAQVENLTTKVESMDTDIKELLALGLTRITALKGN